MKSRIISVISVCSLFVLFSCGTNSQKGKTEKSEATEKAVDNGIGQYTNVKLTHPLDEDMVKRGEEIYKAKCFACHKLTAEKLVGPGWKGVTDRRTPEWIMNFVTNTDVMLDSDLVAQQLMVICVARMPNQNLNGKDARDVLEFMRKNDGKN